MPEFIISANLLIETIKRITIPKKQLPLKLGISIEAKDNYVIFTTIYPTYFQAKVKAEVIKEGEVVIGYHKNLTEILKILKNKIHIKIEEDNLILTSEENLIKIPTIIPIFDKIDLFKEIMKADFYFNITANELEKIIKQVSFCIDTKTDNKVFKGIYFENKNNNLRIVATDGSQLAILDTNIELKEKENFIIPYEELKSFLKERNKEMISFYIKKPSEEKPAKIYLVEELPEASFITSFEAIDRVFPRYEEVIPKEEEYEAEIEINKKEIFEALKEINKFKLKAKNKYSKPLPIVSLSIINDELILQKIKTKDDELEITKKIKIKDKQGKDVKNYFNSEFLLKTFQNIESKNVKIRFSKELIPLKISAPNFLYLLMPIKIKDVL